jgi:hypothetical protein
VRFDVAEEHRLFAESARAAIGDWEPPREPELGAWLDDRDDALAARLAAAGWADIWTDTDLLGAAVAGGLELGRAIAPACLVDEPTLGAPLAVSGRVRHGLDATAVAVPLPRGGMALGRPVSTPVPEATLDGSGTVRVAVELAEKVRPEDANARWRAWSAVTLAYLAGLAAQALALAVEHARTREQFGGPLAALPAVQARLADSALAVDGLTLLAWAAATDEDGGPREAAELVWAGSACNRVTASAHQVHGAVGFALDTGLHRLHRRARAMQTWTTAACAAAR